MKIIISTSATSQINWSSEIKKVRKELGINASNSGGFCAAASSRMWESLGKPKDVYPVSVMYGDEEHVVLYDRSSGSYIDPTADQFGEKVGVVGAAYARQLKNRVKLSKTELEGALREANRRVAKLSGKKTTASDPSEAIEKLKAEIVARGKKEPRSSPGLEKMKSQFNALVKKHGLKTRLYKIDQRLLNRGSLF